MQEKSTEQSWADFPDDLVRMRERWSQSLQEYREFVRTESGLSASEVAELDSEDFGIGKWLDWLLWFVPLAEALKTRAAVSKALANQGFCYDHASLCLVPHQPTSSSYSVICSASGPDTFDVTAVWRDYLRADSEGKREVVRGGSTLWFEGNAEDTADYLVHLAESWEASGIPLP